VFPLRGLLRLASDDLQGCGGGILTLPQPGGPDPRIYIPQELDGQVQSQSHVMTNDQSVSTPCSLVHTTLEVLHPNEFQSNIRRCILRRNFFLLPLGGMHEKLAVHRGIWDQLSICSGTKENLDRVGRSQNLLDANRLLASSPALNTPALTLVPVYVSVTKTNRLLLSNLKT
jgi:hypothetical protein